MRSGELVSDGIRRRSPESNRLLKTIFKQFQTITEDRWRIELVFAKATEVWKVIFFFG